MSQIGTGNINIWCQVNQHDNAQMLQNERKLFGDQRPSSQIRFGYGLLYDYKGIALHGLNRYNLMVGLHIPDVRIAEYFKPEEPDPDYCAQFLHNEYTLLYQTCRHVWPVYMKSIQQVQLYQRQIREIFYEDLPAVLPYFDPNDLGPDPWEDAHLLHKDSDIEDLWNIRHKRAKGKRQRSRRFVQELIGLGIQGLSTYLQHRREKEFKNGMKELLKRQDQLGNKVQALENDMLSVAQAHVHDVQELRDQILYLGSYLKSLQLQVNEQKFDLNHLKARIDDHEQAITLLSQSIYSVLEETQRYVDLYSQLHDKLNRLLDSIDALEKGELKHEIISYHKMEEMLIHVKKQLQTNYPDFELVLENVHNYYSLPLITYGYSKGIIGIQIPCIIKPRLQEPLHLYNLKTVTVPFHINTDLVDENESLYTHTQLQTSSSLLGMSTDTYINLDRNLLDNCHQLGQVYFCETMFLIKHKSEHTCESAIFHYENINVIKSKCTFQYFPKLEPEPELLDAGNFVLLSHLPEPWSVHCKHTDQLPGPLQGSSFSVVTKEDLCGCEIQAGTEIIWHVQANIEYCPNDLLLLDAEIHPMYPINMAVMIYQFQEELNRQRINDKSLFRKPLPLDPEEPNIIVEEDPDILDEEIPSVNMADAMESFLERKYASKEDYAVAMTEPGNWFNGENGWLAFVAIGSIIAILLVIVIIPQILKTCSMAGKLSKVSSNMSKALTLVKSLSSLPSANALGDSDFITLEIKGAFGLFLIIWFFLGACLLFWVLYKIITHVCRYYDMYNLSSIQSKKSWHSYFEFDKTHVYIQLTSPQSPSSMELYVGTFFGNPEDIIIREEYQDMDITFEKYWFWDYINLNWSNCSLLLDRWELQFPNFIQVPLLKKLGVRKAFQKEIVRYRLVSYNPSTCKIRALGPFKLCKSDMINEFGMINDSSDKSQNNAIESPQNLPGRTDELQEETARSNENLPDLSSMRSFRSLDFPFSVGSISTVREGDYMEMTSFKSPAKKAAPNQQNLNVRHEKNLDLGTTNDIVDGERSIYHDGLGEDTLDPETIHIQLHIPPRNTTSS